MEELIKCVQEKLHEEYRCQHYIPDTEKAKQEFFNKTEEFVKNYIINKLMSDKKARKVIGKNDLFYELNDHFLNFSEPPPAPKKPSLENHKRNWKL